MPNPLHDLWPPLSLIRNALAQDDSARALPNSKTATSSQVIAMPGASNSFTEPSTVAEDALTRRDADLLLPLTELAQRREAVTRRAFPAHWAPGRLISVLHEGRLLGVLLNKCVTGSNSYEGGQGGDLWQGWIAASEVDWAGAFDVLLEPHDESFEPMIGLIQTWNAITLRHTPQLCARVQGEVSATQLAALRAVHEESVAQAPLTIAPEPGRIALRTAGGDFSVLSGTPLGPQDPRAEYQALYREVALPLSVPVEAPADRPAFALLALVVVVQNTGLLTPPQDEEEVRFRSTPPVSARVPLPELLVRWKPDVRVEETNLLLQAADAELAGGPDAAGRVTAGAVGRATGRCESTMNKALRVFAEFGVVIVSLLMAMTAGSAAATQRALLVGVSELINQPQALWLQAPRNDVMLMRQALLKQGFAQGDITVLADGVAGASPPEAARIQEALTQLLAQSRSGDFVMLYLSGHGTRLRDATKRYQEPDGLAEKFLARDVDFDGWVQAFLARDVFVWSVFDTFSATSMTRGVGDPPLASRVLPSAAESVARARYVAFFASESHQVTPELRLPRKGRGGRPQGLLAWAVAEALERRPAIWRELYDEVLALYPPVIAELAQRFPTRELPSPVAEGNLDTPLFVNSAAAVSTRPVWRAQRTGAQLMLAAGQLDGLVTMLGMRVLATMDDGTVRSAIGPLTQVELGSARIAIPPELRDLASAAHWNASPVTEPVGMALRVASERGLPANLSLDYPASVIAAATPAQADARWTDFGTAGVRLDVLSPELGNAGVAGQVVDAFEAQFEVWSGDRMVRADTPQRAASTLLPLRAGERAVVGVRNTTGQSLNLVIVGIDALGNVQPVYPAEPISDLRLRGIGPRAVESERHVFAAMVRWGG